MLNMVYTLLTTRVVNWRDKLMVFMLIEQLFHAAVDVVQTHQELGVSGSIYLTYIQLY